MCHCNIVRHGNAVSRSRDGRWRPLHSDWSLIVSVTFVCFIDCSLLDHQIRNQITDQLELQVCDGKFQRKNFVIGEFRRRTRFDFVDEKVGFDQRTGVSRSSARSSMRIDGELFLPGKNKRIFNVCNNI